MDGETSRLLGTPIRPAGLQVARGGEIATSGLSLALRVTRLARRAEAVMARASARALLLACRLPRALDRLQLFGEPRGDWVRVAPTPAFSVHDSRHTALAEICLGQFVRNTLRNVTDFITC